MGEIADAIRRARGLQPKSPDSVGGLLIPSLRTAAAAPSSLAPVRAPAVAPDHCVETVYPENPAIVLENGPNAEVCRHLALRLRTELDERGARSVAIVSAERGDGKTTVACNLALALASLSRGREVALIDLDLRRPSVASYLALPAKRGVEKVLRGEAELDEVLLAVHHPAFDVVPAVNPQSAAHELMVRSQVGELIAELERRYAIVIIDTPPAPLVPDANLVLRHAATCAPVVRTGKTRARFFRRLVDCLPRDQVIGWIVNGDRSSRFRDDDYYYGGEPGVPHVRRGGEAA